MVLSKEIWNKQHIFVEIVKYAREKLWIILPLNWGDWTERDPFMVRYIDPNDYLLYERVILDVMHTILWIEYTIKWQKLIIKDPDCLWDPFNNSERCLDIIYIQRLWEEKDYKCHFNIQDCYYKYDWYWMSSEPDDVKYTDPKIIYDDNLFHKILWINALTHDKYDKNWYDIKWFNKRWLSENCIHKNGTSQYDWRDKRWFDTFWWDKNWYDKRWFNEYCIHKNLTLYDENWYDIRGFNKRWFDRNGINIDLSINDEVLYDNDDPYDDWNEEIRLRLSAQDRDYELEALNSASEVWISYDPVEDWMPEWWDADLDKDDYLSEDISHWWVNPNKSLGDYVKIN